MRTSLKSILLMAALAITGSVARAQLTGTITIPNATYPDLASVVTALNTQGVGTGGVIINLTAATPQTAPIGGYQLGSTLLNASTSAAKTITINGNANVITAPVGTSTTVDGIFIIKGTDYLTINGLNLAENATNAGVSLMEWGYALVNLNNAAPFDGCQNVTIQNCTINLNRLNPNGAFGIFSGHNTATSSTVLSITAAGDTHSNNKFYGDTISNCDEGIFISGFADVSPYTLYDQNNEVGGATAATGNVLTNLGGNTLFNLFAVYMVNQTNGKASNNTINNALGGVGSVAQTIGIYAGGTNNNFTATNNNVSLNVASGAGVTGGVYAVNTGNVTITGNTVSIIDTAGSGTVYGCVSGGAGVVNISNNNITAKSTNTALTNSFYMIYGSATATTENIDNNVINNVSLTTSGTAYLINASNGTPTVSISNNKITNFTRTVSGTTYSIYNLGGPTSGTSTLNGNTIANLTSTGTGSLYGIYYSTVNTHSHIVSNDSVYNLNTGGAAAASYGIYCPSGNSNTYFNNYVANIVTGNSTVYGMYTTGGTGTSTVAGSVYNNIVTGLSSAGTSLYSLFLGSANTVNLYNNKLFNNATSSTTGTAYGLYVSSGTVVNIYNNMISDIKAPLSSGTSPVYGLYLSAGTTLTAYYNTINLNPVSTGTNFGATGIYYSSSLGSLDLRNNIVRVNATAAGTGTVVALRRSSGTANVAPSNLAVTSNANIYYVPTATNHYFYDESTSTTAVNGFNITNDPSFNSSCGLYKKFMSARESNSFTENNLTQIGTTSTYAPTGTSYAESGAIITTPAITTDFNGVARGTNGDIGALQFAGTTPADIAGPVIIYTALPPSTYCTNPPTLTATITDISGVNTTTGTKPRLYYKKSGETNAFGGGNTSATNGWKYVEGTNTGAVFSFAFDYTLLNSAIAIGDSITYFVVAQDNATTPNVSNNAIGFAAGYCPATVNILAAAGPTIVPPAPNGFKIVATPTFATTASPTSICLNGPTTLGLNIAIAAGSTIQWQQDNGTGTFVNITGALGTSTTYTTGALSASNNFRAQIICNGSPVATSTPVAVTIINPTILTSTPATRCGIGTLTLGATASTGSTISWYNSATGGSSIATGSPFTTPALGATTNYYVTAGVLNTYSNLGNTTVPTTTGATAERGIVFTATSNFTLVSAQYYSITTSVTNTVSVRLLDNTTGIVLNTATLPIVQGATAGFYTMTLNFPITAGTTYRLLAGFSQVVSRHTTGVDYTTAAFNNLSPVGTIIGGYDGALTGASYNYFHNIVVNTLCESARTLVPATVTPAPAMTASSPQAPGVCSGTSVTVTATSANTNYGYSWSTGQTTASFTLTPTASTNYVVTATDPGTGCVAKDSVTVNVNAQPAPPTLSPAAATICQGSSVTLTGTPVNNGGPVRLFGESFEGTGLGLFAMSNGPLNNALPGSDWAQYVNGSTLSGVGVVSSNFGTKFAGSNADGGGTSSAAFTQTYLTTTGTYNTTGLTNLAASFRQFYTYYPADSSLLQVSTNGTTWTTVYSNPSTVAVSGTSTSFALITVPLTAYQNVPNLKLRFLYYSNWGYAWAIDSVNLYGVAPVPGMKYTPVTGLYKNATLTTAMVANDTNRIAFASPATTTTYSVVTNLQGCLSAPSNNAVVTVNPAPLTAITYTGATTLCQPATALLTAPTAPTGASYTYQWNRGGTPIAGATSQTYAADSTGCYTVTVTNINSLPTACAFTTVTPVCITVNPAPATAITAGGSTIFCTGGSVQLCAPTPPTGTTYTYLWKNNNVSTGQTTQCITQSLSGNFTVTVTNTTTTCFATTPAATVVTAGAPPAAPISAASSAVICQGQSVRLRTNNVPGLSYQWKLGGIDIPGAIDSFYVATLAGNYTVNVNITGVPTCGSLSSILAVTVNPLPAAAITASGAPTTFCQGGSVVLTATPAGLNYQWPTPATGTTNAQLYTATASGNYTAVVTNPTTGCFATSNIIPVTVNPLPTATITAVGATAICAGTSVVLNANTGTGLTYQWSNGAGPITGATAASYTATTAGSYTVKVTNANNCFATSAVTTVTVNPLPPTTVSPTGAVNICSGSSITLNGPTSPTGLSYQWKNGVTNATGTSTAATYTTNTAGAYRVVVTTAAGCKDSSGVTTVTLLPLPAVVMSPTVATTSCDSVVLSTTNTGVTYQWNYNGNPIIGANNSTYAAQVSGNYSLTNMSTVNGCTATSANVAITVNISPTALITYSSPINFCEGSAVVLNTYAGANLSYEWRESNTPIPGATTSSYITTATGFYTVKVTNTVNNCVSISPAVNVRVNPTPHPVIAYNAPINQLSTTQPFVRYQWLLDNQTIGGATQSTYNPRQNGAYMVFVTDTNGCVNQSTIFFVNSVGIVNTAAGKSIRIYPNPTSGVLHIQSPVKISALLRDVTGRTVLQGDIQSELNLEHLSDGIYLLYIRDESGQLIRAEKITKTSN